jgi:hypothetical protein
MVSLSGSRSAFFLSALATLLTENAGENLAGHVVGRRRCHHNRKKCSVSHPGHFNFMTGEVVIEVGLRYNGYLKKASGANPRCSGDD